MRSWMSDGGSSSPSRLRRIRSAACATLVGDDRLPRKTPRPRLAAQPRVNGRPDVRELALVDASGGVLPLDVCEQEGVLARVIRRRRRRIATVIRREDEQVVAAQRVEQVGKTPIEVL